MSIAISFVLHPSKILQFLAILLSILLIFVAIYVGYFALIPVFARSALAFACLLGSIFNLIIHYSAARRSWHIVVGGQGDFRCVALGPDGRSLKSSSGFGRSYKLTSGSILWTKILILHLQSLNDDNMLNLVVPSDAVSENEFRCMSIACRWINSHATSAIRN